MSFISKTNNFISKTNYLLVGLYFTAYQPLEFFQADDIFVLFILEGYTTFSEFNSLSI